MSYAAMLQAYVYGALAWAFVQGLCGDTALPRVYLKVALWPLTAACTAGALVRRLASRL